LAMGREHPTLIRQVCGLSGRVRMRTEVIIRFDYGSVVPWVQHEAPGLRAVAGPDALVLQSPVPLAGKDFASAALWEVAAGESAAFVMTHLPSHLPFDDIVDADQVVKQTEDWWARWVQTGDLLQGRWAGVVRRSALTLKALTFSETGGIVAAPTTSLPETLGGGRNWDYRFCWLRDATFTLYALLLNGFHEEARAWREWLLRAVAGRPQDLQILYGISGARRVPEWEADWLPGYQGSTPVRIGNAAKGQFQLDVFGEVLDVLHLARRADLALRDDSWNLQRELLDYLESSWTRPDTSIWEVRGPLQHFTYSKVMAWVAFDRAAKAVTDFGLPGPGKHWRALAEQVHADVCAHGYDAERGTFVQSYGSDRLDGALLLLPLVGFLPATDERMRGTVAAIEDELLRDGLVRRYLPDPSMDGVDSDDEGVFLPCSFWLADNYALQGRQAEAEALFERLLSLCNDVGLLSEEYDPATGRQLGNFPQAFSHVALINTAHNLSGGWGPAHHRPSSERQRYLGPGRA
ncbi:MAG: glycoside hydrolase family 15 protein, partial [Chromatiaceae bacterium]